MAIGWRPVSVLHFSVTDLSIRELEPLAVPWRNIRTDVTPIEAVNGIEGFVCATAEAHNGDFRAQSVDPHDPAVTDTFGPFPESWPAVGEAVSVYWRAEPSTDD